MVFMNLRRVYPEFNEEESVLGSLLKEVFEPAILLRELVLNSSDPYCLHPSVSEAGGGIDVHKLMLLVLLGEQRRP